MYSNYTKIFTGSQVESQSIIAKLKDIGIVAVVKDEGESARLAGFGSSPATDIEVYVHHDELSKAQSALAETTDN